MDARKTYYKHGLAYSTEDDFARHKCKKCDQLIPYYHKYCSTHHREVLDAMFTSFSGYWYDT